MTPSALDLYERGVRQANRGSYAQARRTLAGADAKATGAGDLELHARITGTTAYVLARLGDVDSGEKLCREVLERGGLSAEAVAQLHGQLGALALERGLLDDAAAWLTKSIRGLAADPVRQANMRTNRALVDMQRGRLDAVMADLELAESAYRAAGLPDEVNLTIHNRGYAQMLAGDLVTALQTMQSVREPLDDESDVWAAINELDRAEVLREAGLVTEAERSLESVTRAFGLHRAPRERATAEYHLARSLLSHDPERAARAAAAAARRFAGIGSPGWMVRAEAIRLRGQLAVGRIDRAGAPVRVPRRLPSARSVERVAGDLRAHGFSSEADALILTEALARLRLRSPTGVSVRIGKRTPLETALLSHELQAARAAAAGRASDSRRHAARGLDLLESTRQAVGSLDLQVSATMRGSGLITAGLSSAVQSGRPDVVFDWSERARVMSQQILPVRPPPDPELAADLAELRVLRAAAPDGDWLAAPRAALLRDRARERQWSSTGAREVSSRATLEEARASLLDGDVLLSYVFDGRRLVLLSTSRSQTRFLDLDWPAVRSALNGLRADLDVSATVTAGPMARLVRAGLDGRLAALSALLVTDGAVPSGASRIVLTAPGVLAGVPWMMLPALRARVVTLTSSATNWVRDRSLPWRPARTAGLAVGPRVPRGDEEVDAAASAWHESAVLRGGTATVAAVVDVASRVDVLHVAAHGRHAVDNPLFSGLELADGALFGYDIDLMPRVPAAVVLSACEVGRSSVHWGEEAIGMTRIWLHAGARCVVAAPVIVADDVACELLSVMHEGLAAGEPPAVALAGASERTGIVAPFQAHGAGF